MHASALSRAQSPAIAAPARRPALRAAAVAFLCLLLAGAGFFAGWHGGFDQAADRRRQLPNGSVLCKPGPWGDLSYTPFTIAAPDDLLPVRTLEAAGTRWFFGGYTPDTFVTLLQSTSLTPDQQHALLDASVCHFLPNGVQLTPTPDLVFSLPPDAREKLYLILARSSENDAQLHYIPVDTLKERFDGTGVSQPAMDLFQRLCCQRGHYLIFSGLPALLSRIPGYDEKVHFLKALTRQRTMLLRLHITPQSDVDALTQYWGRGVWNTDVLTIIPSLTAIPDGTWMSVLMLLPPLPTAQIYDYPNIADNPLDGPPVNRDCHWTSLNFFRDIPDNDFGTAAGVLKELKDNYYPIPGDPVYGDVLLFAKPDGSIIHSAVYIADDICFTKNGGTVIHPWMLSTITDLLDQYSCQIDPDQKLTVTYYRNKRL